MSSFVHILLDLVRMVALHARRSEAFLASKAFPLPTRGPACGVGPVLLIVQMLSHCPGNDSKPPRIAALSDR